MLIATEVRTFVFLTLLAACGVSGTKPSAEPLVGSCDDRGGSSVCVEYPRAIADSLEYLKDACTAARGQFNADPCAADDWIGRCAMRGGSIRNYYRGGGRELDRNTALEECTGVFGGTWM